jgi:hypothetical protein
MSKERELLQRCLDEFEYKGVACNELCIDINKLLAQPEQEPVAWITEWVQRYRHNDTPIMDRAVSFTKGDAPAVPNPNYIPLYTAPPKREPLSDKDIGKGFLLTDVWHRYECFIAGVKWAEKHHGIGVDDESI